MDKTIELGNRMILPPISCISTAIPAGTLPAEAAALAEVFVAQADPPE